MTTKKRLMEKPKTLIRKYSAQHLTLRYSELLRLRQAVRQAESLAGRVSQNQSAPTAN